jgi:feruloyl esterase
LTLTAVALAACGGDDHETEANVNAVQACATLSGKTVGGATLTAVVVAASGAVPTYCKVNGTIAPSLNFEVRLPDSWNGKLYYGGGGGYNGSIPPVALSALAQGYAQVASDSGHQAAALDASFALTDAFAAQLFGSLSVPTVMSTALGVVTAAYRSPPTKSYFEGCSGGGREALMAAQRNPNLFDGIIARAPAYNWVGFAGQFHRNAKAMAVPGAQFTNAKLVLLSKAVRDACDAQDGIADGIVSNPQACKFNPASLRCAGGADTGDTCLSDVQLAVVNAVTAPASWAGGAYTSAGWPLTGNEEDPGAWGAWITGNGAASNAVQYLFQDTTIKNYLARNPAQDSVAYEYESNLDRLYSMAALNDATNADLRAFKNSNAKLILWHGGNDAALSPKSTAAYYEAVRTAAGGPAAADEFVRLYIAPGVNHCEGGPGADQTDLLSALDAWADRGTAPGTLTATKVVNGVIQASQPLCRYPQYPRYTGPANDAAAAALAANYTCTAP